MATTKNTQTFNNAVIVFDIETGPQPESKLFANVDPFVAPEPLADFDPSTVKTGNLKDPVKIEAKVEAERSKHQAEVDNYGAKCKQDEADWRASTIERAPLDPLVGQVLAIGYKSEKGKAIQVVSDKTTEATLLELFWERYAECRQNGRQLVGHNILDFDLPFIARRSWILGVEFPETAFDGRFWDQRVFVDTMKIWACGKHQDRCKLDRLGKAFGGAGKLEGVSGAMFWRLFQGSPEDRKLALDYLKQDLEVTFNVAKRLGV